MPSLSVCCVTRNSGGHLADWIARARAYADEVVVSVDSASTDDTLAVARREADVVHAVEVGGLIESALDWTCRQAAGDWILKLDDDEYLTRAAPALLPALLGDEAISHWRIPVRWVVPAPDAAGLAWLRQFPWLSTGWGRLVRNAAAGYQWPGFLHAELVAAGDGGTLDADGPLAVWHLDTLWNSRAAREAKVARYAAARRADGIDGAEYYLYEDYASTIAFAPVPEDEGLPEQRAASEGRPTKAEQVVAAGDLAEHRRRMELAPLPDASGVAEGIWAADYLEHRTPARLLTARGYAVPVRVRNASAATWRSPGTVAGRVALSYRWSTKAWGPEVPLGDTTPLPRPLAPGDETWILAGLWTPSEPGRYLLTWDLLCERVSWFSRQGVAPLEVEVEVADDATLPRPTASHFARPLAAEPPPGLAAGALVPHGPIRVLDTRDGGGVSGAAQGPLRADEMVVLLIGGEAGVPRGASAIVATLSVIDATYDGFVSAFATDGTFGEAFPALHFAPGRACSTLVFSGLGSGRGADRLSLRLSPGDAGASAHVLLDITGYVVG